MTAQEKQALTDLVSQWRRYSDANDQTWGDNDCRIYDVDDCADELHEFLSALETT